MNADLDRATRRTAALCHLTALPKIWIFGLLTVLFGVTTFQVMDFNEYYGLGGVVPNIGGMWVVVIVLAGINQLIGVRLARCYCRAVGSRHEFIQVHGDAAVRFQQRFWQVSLISLLLWTLLFMTICGVGPTDMDTVYGTAIAAFLWLSALGVFNAIVTLMATVHAAQGRFYRYPFGQF